MGKVLLVPSYRYSWRRAVLKLAIPSPAAGVKSAIAPTGEECAKMPAQPARLPGKGGKAPTAARPSQIAPFQESAGESSVLTMI